MYDKYHKRDMKHHGCLKEGRSFPIKGSSKSFIELGGVAGQWAEFRHTCGCGEAFQVQKAVITKKRENGTPGL